MVFQLIQLGQGSPPWQPCRFRVVDPFESVYRALVGALFLSFLAPIFLGPGLLSDFVSSVFRLVCADQHPLKVLSFPSSFLCVRCTFVVLGVIVGRLVRTPHLGALSAYLAGLLIIPMILDGTMQLLHIHDSSFASRAITGSLAGLGLHLNLQVFGELVVKEGLNG